MLKESLQAVATNISLIKSTDRVAQIADLFLKSVSDSSSHTIREVVADAVCRIPMIIKQKEKPITNMW